MRIKFNNTIVESDKLIIEYPKYYDAILIYVQYKDNCANNYYTTIQCVRVYDFILPHRKRVKSVAKDLFDGLLMDGYIDLDMEIEGALKKDKYDCFKFLPSDVSIPSPCKEILGRTIDYLDGTYQCINDEDGGYLWMKTW